MKIFVSYSRRDAGDFAEQIQKHFSSFNHDVFTDVNSISAGDIWSSTIEENISNCDVFVSIVTYGALQSPHVENEFSQAQREKKKVIPCFHRNVREDDIKWGLSKIQGVEFTDKYELARDLYSKIARIERDSHKKAGGIFGSSSKEASEVGHNSNKHKEVQQSKGETPMQYTSTPTYKKDPKKNHTTLKSKKRQINILKIAVPVIIVAVIGSIFALGIYNPLLPPSDEQYSFVKAWGEYGQGPGEFFGGAGEIAVDSAGNVYVTDSGNHRIQKFDSGGTHIASFGSEGSGDGQFELPTGVAVDSPGNVYVADYQNQRIQKFDSAGNFITKWGSRGLGDGQFEKPTGVAVDSEGNVYVADSASNASRIQKFDSNGSFIMKWGSEGSGDGQFEQPYDIAVDSAGNVYVAEFGNNRIQKFDSEGNFITKWGSIGEGDGQFEEPTGVAVDSPGNVYVADYNRIQKFDSAGNFITKWGSVCDKFTKEGCIDPDAAGPLESGDGQFESLIDIAVDSAGKVYVTDSSSMEQGVTVFAPRT